MSAGSIFMVFAIGLVKGVAAFPSLWLVSYVKDRMDLLWDWVGWFIALFAVLLGWIVLDEVMNLFVAPRVIKANFSYFIAGFLVGAVFGIWLIRKKFR